jgi:hypothetical protein
VLEQFTTARLVGDTKCFTDKLKGIENKFDYLVFICELYSKQVTYDLTDIYYDNKFSKLHQDLESIEVLKNRLMIEDSIEPDLKTKVNGQDVTEKERKYIYDKAPKTIEVKSQGSSANGRFKLDFSLEKAQNKVNKVKETDGNYDTWNKSDWKEACQATGRLENSDEADLSPKDAENRSMRNYMLTITVEKAEGLVFSRAGEAANFKFSASFVVYNPSTANEIGKEYISDIASRNSTPVWNFDMKYQFSNLRSFFSLNREADILIEIVQVENSQNDEPQHCSETFVTSVNGMILEKITEDDIYNLENEEPSTPAAVSKSFTFENYSGVKVYMRVEISALTESIDNPFREGLMDDDAVDAERGMIMFILESLLKMKKTLEELKQFEDVDVDDRNVLSSQKMFDNLKNTLSSSELFKPQNYSAVDTQPKIDSRGPQQKRSSSLVPGNDALGHSTGPISEPGKFYRSLEPVDELDHLKNTRASKNKDNPIECSQPNFGYNLKPAQDKIHLEDYTEEVDERGSIKDKGDLQEGHPNQSDQNIITVNPSFGDEQMRPTSDFAVPLDTVKDDSQEAASSYNPFRQNLLNRDAGSRAEEVSEDSSPAKVRTKKENNQIIKGLKDRLPGGKLKGEDLERIERIFRSKKFDAKILDLEDSDIEYF